MITGNKWRLCYQLFARRVGGLAIVKVVFFYPFQYVTQGFLLHSRRKFHSGAQLVQTRCGFCKEPNIIDALMDYVL